MELLSTFLLLLAFTASTEASDLLITPEVRQRAVFVGDNFVVSCQGSGNKVQRVMWTGPENTQIIDYRKRTTKTNGDNSRIHIEAGQAGSVDLWFTKIALKDRGMYTCSANVDGQELQKEFELIVLKSIDFSNTDKIQYLSETSTSSLVCDVDAIPHAVISWRHKDKTLYSGGRYEIGNDGQQLTIKNVTVEDGGNYVCFAKQMSNHTSDFKSFDINALIHHKPRWRGTKSDGPTYGYIQGQVNLTCEAVAEPAAKFTWSKNGDVLGPTEGVHIYNENHKSVLQLSISSDDVFGDYECQVENKLGTLKTVIPLEEGIAPPIPSLVKQRSETNAILLELKVENEDALMPVTSYRVEYKVAGGTWFPQVDFKKGDLYKVKDLDPDTVYVFRGAARNNAGLSNFSEPIALSTEKAPLVGGLTDGASSLVPFNQFYGMILPLLLAKLFL